MEYAFQQEASMKLSIKVPQVYVHREVTHAEYDVIVAMTDRDLLVTAIKFVRDQYGLSLKEAKDLVDEIRRLGVRKLVL